MDPDEVFTINFGIDSRNPSRPINGPVNLTFRSKFKNGDNWHESSAYTASYSPPGDRSNQSLPLLPMGAAAVVLIAGGYWIYRRRKMANKKAADSSA
jgi:hypothetical protein